ncbi:MULTISPECIES: ATP-dependent DNA helicase RecG [Kocuria]|jgi:ATP-dependent DNA helicase RecG|uniref:ATP-dependent DNA helicase RecG n=1 Tax=Kocuria TaxID=57493 RepID=UPI00203E76BF|nr:MULTISPECIES: ATP-dependent DNA helicase RecG [Kocuria]MCM3686697.1 ATP-dependent DNA helicase RecG [Kocuria rosea]HST72906.1 ATP-dependent DNA helicase RecG [Kocuria rosea]
MTRSPGAGAFPGPLSELDQPLARLLGRSTADQLARQLGVSTIGQLLDYFPRKYMPRGELTPFAELRIDQQVTIVAEVVHASTRQMRSRRGSITDVVITDRASSDPHRLFEDGDPGPGRTMRLSFFNAWTAAKDLPPGTHALFSGKVGLYNGSVTMTNPHYAILDPDAPEAGESAEERAGRPIPIYPATAKLTTDKIARAVHSLLPVVDFGAVPDPLPEDIRARERLMGLEEAYRQIHRPRDTRAHGEARRRFRYQEAFLLQCALARRRIELAAHPTTARPGAPGGLLGRFDAALPFELTAGQRAVGAELAAELAGTHPMNRLLQGDVGAGKTLVALRAMLQVVDSGAQAALLAPTEVLAAQHHGSVLRSLGPLGRGGQLDGDPDGTQVVLLTGSMGAAARKRALLQIASGEAGIVIGTHALLSEVVQFADLGLVVVDEQHRFGVEQRDRLRDKAGRPPHLLVMTATPIPRTVAMTVFGDLDVSVLDQLPAGRQPITTHTVGLVEHPGWEQRLWRRAREEIDAGRQVYVVAPKIGDDDEPAPFSSLAESALAAATEDEAEAAMASVTWLAELVAHEPALQGVRAEVLHGRLDPAEKSRVMQEFADGAVQLLVCTTVVEVGVDVPNATLMVIVDADRFGISQLHQLRGRIGRGGHAGTCLLVTRRPAEHPSRERIDVVAGSTDGFELARADLELRREGDILGAAQSGGRSTLRLLRALDDAELIERARRDAVTILGEDPQLLEHPELAEAIERYLDPDAEAFLDRG